MTAMHTCWERTVISITRSNNAGTSILLQMALVKIILWAIVITLDSANFNRCRLWLRSFKIHLAKREATQVGRENHLKETYHGVSKRIKFSSHYNRRKATASAKLSEITVRGHLVEIIFHKSMKLIMLNNSTLRGVKELISIRNFRVKCFSNSSGLGRKELDRIPRCSIKITNLSPRAIKQQLMVQLVSID